MNAIEQLKSVLCDPEGKCCIAGSDEDRAIIDRALQALAQRTEQEPNRTGMVYYKNDACKAKDAYAHDCICWTKAQPPQRTEPLIGCVNHDCAKCKPLTDEQRKDLMNKAWNKWLGGEDDNHLFAWHFSFEVEAAHGIKEDT